MSSGYEPGVLPEWMTASGTTAWAVQTQARLREVLAGRPDLENAASKDVAAGHEAAINDVMRAHGRRLSFNPSDLDDQGGAVVALRALEDREAEYCRAYQAHAPKAVVALARERVVSALRAFISTATKGWLPKVEFERKQQQDRDEALGFTPARVSDLDSAFHRRRWGGR
jgi:hypothetical protein